MNSMEIATQNKIVDAIEHQERTINSLLISIEALLNIVRGHTETIDKLTSAILNEKKK